MTAATAVSVSVLQLGIHHGRSFDLRLAVLDQRFAVSDCLFDGYFQKGCGVFAAGVMVVSWFLRPKSRAALLPNHRREIFDRCRICRRTNDSKWRATK
jgi:hypothetical protein